MMQRNIALRVFSSHTAAFHSSQPRSKQVDTKIPEADYYHGHLMTDHLEYLDDVLDKSIQLQSELCDLEQIYAKKQKSYNNVGWMNSAEIDQLFHEAKTKKANMKEQLAQMRSTLEAAKSKAKIAIAVDAPDGTSDDLEQGEKRYIQHIIDEAALHENQDTIRLQRAADAANRKVLAVDGPDGIPEQATLADDRHAVDEIIEEAAKLENQKAFREKRAADAANRKVLAVDGPDGIPEQAERNEELHVLDEILEEAALHEDKAKVEWSHKVTEAVAKERARDPEHNW